MHSRSLPAYLLRFMLLLLLYEVLAMALIPAADALWPATSSGPLVMAAQTAAALITIAAGGYIYLKETAGERQKLSGEAVILAGITGNAAGIIGNLIMNLTALPDSSGAFDAASDVLFSTAFPFQVISLCLVIPLCEELLYRGFFQRYLRYYTGRLTAVLITSLLFALLHGNIVQGIYAFVTGMIMGFIFEKYKNVLAPYIFHCLANLSAVILGLLL